MNLPEAKVICDSVSPDGSRLTTMEVKIHRFVLAEFNTHRVFSRNSASSRAIPIKKQIERVQSDPAMPLFWGKNQAGMGAAEELPLEEKLYAQKMWLEARDKAVQIVKDLLDINLHKQLSNRLLEPFMWQTIIVSSTEFINFFGQRCAINPDTDQPFAQPEMFYASIAMQKAYYESAPKKISYGGWHLPYIDDETYDWAAKFSDTEIQYFEKLKMVSAGRCARVSYLTHDGKRDPAEDVKLSCKLMEAKPMHPSPFEHVATPNDGGWDVTNRGNFKGWVQWRHFFKGENITQFEPNYMRYI